MAMGGVDPAYSEHDAVYRARAAAVQGIFSGLIKGERIWRWQEHGQPPHIFLPRCFWSLTLASQQAGISGMRFNKVIAAKSRSRVRN